MAPDALLTRLSYRKKPWRDYIVRPVHHRCCSILAKNWLRPQRLDDWSERLRAIDFRSSDLVPHREPLLLHIAPPLQPIAKSALAKRRDIAKDSRSVS